MIRESADGLLLDIKAVPGARQDQIVGPLGRRLKVRVSAPPEDGKANKAICSLIAEAAGVKPSRVEVVSGHASPIKTLRIIGVNAPELAERLGVG